MGDFLSVDKMEEKDFKPNLTKFHVSEAIGEIIRDMQSILKPGQQIFYEHKGDNDIAYIDHSMFLHILTNLLSNAIKYSPESGGVEIITEHLDQTLVLKVKDYGIGIPKDDLQNLYKRFFRCRNATHVQGTGLGLNIVKKYVDILDGTIECVSEEKKGTEFIITFNNQTESYEDNIGS